MNSKRRQETAARSRPTGVTEKAQVSPAHLGLGQQVGDRGCREAARAHVREPSPPTPPSPARVADAGLLCLEARGAAEVAKGQRGCAIIKLRCRAQRSAPGQRTRNKQQKSGSLKARRLFSSLSTHKRRWERAAGFLGARSAGGPRCLHPHSLSVRLSARCSVLLLFLRGEGVGRGLGKLCYLVYLARQEVSRGL